MLSWLRRRRETTERIDAEADALIGELGVEAYADARRREYESSDDAIALRWDQVALAVGRKSGKLVGLDTSTRMAMNAAFAPDREHAGDRKPQPLSQVDELKGALTLEPFRLQFISSAPDRGPSIVTELEIHASDASGAIVAAAKIAMPPERSDCASSTVMAARSLPTEGRPLNEGQMTEKPSEVCLAGYFFGRKPQSAAVAIAGRLNATTKKP